MERRSKVVRDIVLTCVALQMLRTHLGVVVGAPTPADDTAAIVNELVVYVPDENYTSPSRNAKASVRPTEGLLQSHWCIRWARGEDLRYDKNLTLR